MSNTDVAARPRAISHDPDGRAPRIDYPSRRVKAAIRCMIELGSDMQHAAAQAGLTTHALRLALEKPNIVAYMRAQRQAFRAAINCKNELRLAQIRDAADNMPAVNAIKALEQIEDEQVLASKVAANPNYFSPRLTINIVSAGASTPPVSHALPSDARETLEHSEISGLDPADHLSANQPTIQKSTDEATEGEN